MHRTPSSVGPARCRISPAWPEPRDRCRLAVAVPAACDIVHVGVRHDRSSAGAACCGVGQTVPHSGRAPVEPLRPCGRVVPSCGDGVEAGVAAGPRAGAAALRRASRYPCLLDRCAGWSQRWPPPAAPAHAASSSSTSGASSRPRSADKVLQQYVSQLRRAAPALALADHRHRLRPGAARRRSRRPALRGSRGCGRQALRAGDPALAASVLRHADALWDGPAYEEFAHEVFADAEATRLEGLRRGRPGGPLGG
jgi:hypothetical protein